MFAWIADGALCVPPRRDPFFPPFVPPGRDPFFLPEDSFLSLGGFLLPLLLVVVRWMTIYMALVIDGFSRKDATGFSWIRYSCYSCYSCQSYELCS